MSTKANREVINKIFHLAARTHNTGINGSSITEDHPELLAMIMDKKEILKCFFWLEAKGYAFILDEEQIDSVHVKYYLMLTGKGLRMAQLIPPQASLAII